MATLTQTWSTSDHQSEEKLWGTFMKQALGYLKFVPANEACSPGIYPLYEDFGFSTCIAALFLVNPEADIDDLAIGRFWPAKLIGELKRRKLNWGILTDGRMWRLYSTKSSRPYEDYVELPLVKALEGNDEAEYGLFERFFHKESFIPKELDDDKEQTKQDEAAGVYKCRLDTDKEESESVLDEWAKTPLLRQVDEILQYLCNGFIADTPRKGEEYTEEEREEIFESAVKLLYRCLFLFYAEARRLLPSEKDKAEIYQKHSIRALCQEAHKFRWDQRTDNDKYDLWKHFKGLINAVNDGDPEYGIMGYNGGLFDDEEEVFLGRHKLRNDFFSRALYLLAYVEPFDSNPDDEYPIPYEDLEVRHLGELYENILEYTVMLADADRIRRRTKKGIEILLASETTRGKNETLIRKGDVYFGESALERKQTGSYYTPESLVRFLNTKAIIAPLRERFETDYRQRFDQFLTQAGEDYQATSAASAIRSAAALLQRYVDEVVLPFKACDPAMGSGHFLVDAANQMAGLVVELFADIPAISNLGGEINSDPNNWRRLITRHCLYGVDLNPLAVNLAKLSLWLNCFASHHRLTFLDHHVRCGNSLIGLRDIDQLKMIPKRKNDRKTKKQTNLLKDFGDLSEVLGQAAEMTRSITDIDEDDTDQQKEIFEEAHDTTEGTIAPLADLFTAYLMDVEIGEEDYVLLFEHFAQGHMDGAINNRSLSELWSHIREYRKGHNFFHWPIEFPEVFGQNGYGGFGATVGNPPWDIVKPNSQEFFSDYDPKFRSYQKQEANRVSKQLMEHNPAIQEAWQQYCDSFEQQSTYFRQPSSYPNLGKGDNNTFKLFLGQFFYLLKTSGHMGIVVPSGLYTDLGCQPLRELFFDHSRIDFLYCFENKRGIFNIHRMFKFVIFSAIKGGKTDAFKCAFMEHDPDRLPAIEANALEMDVDQVRRFSPDSLSIMEFNNQTDINVTSRIYANHLLLGETSDGTWQLILEREIQNNAAAYLHTEQDKGRPLIEGKKIHQFDYEYGLPTYCFDDDAYVALAGTESYIADSRVAVQGKKRLNCSQYRLVVRRQAASTNERTLILTVIQPGDLCGDNLEVNKPFDSFGQLLMPPNVLLCVVGIMNSFVIDYVIRNKVTTNLNKFYLYQLPLPRTAIEAEGSIFSSPLTARVARLVCTSSAFSCLWKKVYTPSWGSSEFWYPPNVCSIDSYGPEHEQNSRKAIADSVVDLTEEWHQECGGCDRTEERRDTGKRAQLRAELDAYVAHLYGLSHDDFEYILGTFPVLERKEKAAFGEFMSKRKCLEEYDRLTLVLRGDNKK